MRYFAGAIALSLLLAACSSSEPESEPIEPEEATEVPVAASPDALTSQGWRDARIGMRLEDVVAALGPDAEPEAVGGPEPEYCDQFRPESAPEGLFAMIEEGVLTRITLYEGDEIKTDQGLGIGDSIDAVRAAYGDRIIDTEHTYLGPEGRYFTIWDEGVDTSGPYVEDPDARGIRYEIDHEGQVNTIHVGGPAIQYVEGCL